LAAAQYFDADSGVIGARVYCDETIYRQELDRVFGRCWLYLAHESQISSPGQFVAAYMAEDPVIVVRQRDGTVAGFLNQCRHRGMRVCRMDYGHANGFFCSYHGWSYGIDGRLVSVPQERSAYAGRLDKLQWGLIRIPRIESYKGLIFGCWAEDVPALPEYLGNFAWYMDGFLDRVDGGTEIFGDPHKWTIPCNWKLPAEQFCSDMYHAATTHQSAVRVMAADNFDPQVQGFRGIQGVQFSDRGHGGGAVEASAPTPNVWYEPTAQRWLYDTFPQVEQRLGTMRASRFAGHNTVFPNLSFLVGTQTLRVWHPRAPDEVEVWAWVLVDRAAPPEAKEAFRLGAVRAFGPAGLLEQDDSENWTAVQRGLKGAMGRRSSFNLSMGKGGEYRRAGLPGVLNSIISETAARGFYQRWADLMSAETWDEVERLRRERDETQR
jgi:3-phenylpropionate/trans-cinnamate dioxygenase subunit alpha